MRRNINVSSALYKGKFAFPDQLCDTSTDNFLCKAKREEEIESLPVEPLWYN
jgi:hypothetical protein